MSFEKKVKRVAQRDWLVVKRLWVTHCAHLTGDGQRPLTSPVEVLANQIDDAKQLPVDGEQREGGQGFREALIADAVYSLHRAAHVLGSAEIHLEAGISTWSISGAYQSAFLGMDAVLKLLGIGVLEIGNTPVVVDVWPGPSADLSKDQRRSYSVGSEINIVRHAVRFDHYHRWAILQRAINTVANLPFNRRLVGTLCGFGDRSFARQRNELHYYGAWYFDDLFEAKIQDGFCRAANSEEIVKQLSEETNAFSYILATALVFMGEQLLVEIGDGSPGAKAEAERLVGSFEGALHPLFKRQLIEDAWKRP